MSVPELEARQSVQKPLLWTFNLGTWTGNGLAAPYVRIKVGHLGTQSP